MRDHIVSVSDCTKSNAQYCMNNVDDRNNWPVYQKSNMAWNIGKNKQRHVYDELDRADNKKCDHNEVPPSGFVNSEDKIFKH